jgi:hypothetical protein
MPLPSASGGGTNGFVPCLELRFLCSQAGQLDFPLLDFDGFIELIPSSGLAGGAHTPNQDRLAQLP